MYSDTGTFICSYNGTVDLTSIDNSSNVHLFVDDGVHLLKYSSFEFFRATQGSKFTLPCMPTMPEVNVTLWRETSGHKQIFPDKYVSYNPKVSKVTKIGTAWKQNKKVVPIPLNFQRNKHHDHRKVVLTSGWL